MKKLIISITIMFILSLSSVGSVFAKEQANCPVMGGKINKEIFADYDSERVYFCCPMCIDTFKKDPAKYLKKLEVEGVRLSKAAPQIQHKKDDKSHDHNDN
jgi:YHS domain-containing protein